jgi:hypothetical protein
MFMKRTILTTLCAALAFMLAACATPSPTAPPVEFTDPLTEAVRAISDDAGSRIGEHGVGMVYETEVSAETQNITLLGVTEEQFSTYVADAAVSQGMLAHLTALIRCKDEASAREMKSLIAAGFNPSWMICVEAEECVVVEAGVYVYLAASTSEACAELLKSFETAAGGMGSPDVFHLGVRDGDGDVETAP